SSLRTGFSPPLLPDALPTTWAGHALAAIVLGRPATGLVYFLATLSLATLLYGLAIGLSARMLATGSATYGEVRRRAATSHANHPSSMARLPIAPQTTHQRRVSAGIRGRVA